MKPKTRRSKAAPKDYAVYILRCGDGSFYTGIAKDVEARLEQHRSRKGAAYTRSRLPLKLLYQENGFTRGEALSREAEIKSLSRDAKKKLVKG